MNVMRRLTAEGMLGAVLEHEDVGYAWAVDCNSCYTDFDGNRAVENALEHLNIEVTT